MRIGFIGLGRMGGNMVRRLIRDGHEVVAYNRTPEKTREIAGEGAIPSFSIAELVEKLEKPRTVWIMVPAGDATEAQIAELMEHLEPGDTIIDAAIRLSSGESLDLAAAVRRRYDDLRRVIDGVTSASAAASSDTNRVPFAGSVDPDRIVLAGHSLGGAGAVGAAAADPRVDAVIAMDATWGILTPEELAEVQVPVLIMYGMAGQAPGSREIEAGTAAPWYRTDLTRASHVGFTDACSYQALVPGWMAAGAPAEVEAYVAELTAADCGPSVLPSDRLHDLVDGYSLAFLARYLDGDPAWDATLVQPRPDVEVDHNP
jgi:predicted dienelactone hydrolase